MAEWTKKYFPIIVLVLMLLMGVKSCADSRKMDKILSENENIRTEIKAIKDSTYTKKQLDIRLRVAGLESEKRMIQATDRKMLDVQRQNTIEQEIIYWNEELDKLENKP